MLPIPEQVTRVPGAKPWFRGIANLRGQLLTVVDLKSFLGAGAPATDRQARVLVVASREVPTGLIVDEVVGFRRFGSADYRDEATPGVIRCEHYVEGSYRRGSRAMAAVQPAEVARGPAVPDGGRDGEAMTKIEPVAEDAAVLGIALAIALLAAAGSVWWSGSGTTTVNDGGLGELIAVTQAARAESSAAVQGDAAAFDALAASRAAIARLRGAVGANEAASADARGWPASGAVAAHREQPRHGSSSAREPLAELDEGARRNQRARAAAARCGRQRRERLAAGRPRGESTVSPALRAHGRVAAAERARARPHGVGVAESVRRLEDAEQYLGQFVRGLRGEDGTLGVVAVRDRRRRRMLRVALGSARAGAGRALQRSAPAPRRLSAALAAITRARRARRQSC